MPESSFDTTIEREKVEQLVENIRATMDEVTTILEADEIEIEKLLEATRYIARSARRVSRRANWTVGEPQPGNEREPKRSGGKSHRDDRAPRGGRGRDDRAPRRGGSGRGDDRRDDDRRPRRPSRGGNSGGYSSSRSRGGFNR